MRKDKFVKFEGYLDPQINASNIHDFCVSQGYSRWCSFGGGNFTCSSENFCFQEQDGIKNKYYTYDYHLKLIGERII